MTRNDNKNVMIQLQTHNDSSACSNNNSHIIFAVVIIHIFITTFMAVHSHVLPGENLLLTLLNPHQKWISYKLMYEIVKFSVLNVIKIPFIAHSNGFLLLLSATCSSSWRWGMTNGLILPPLLFVAFSCILLQWQKHLIQSSENCRGKLINEYLSPLNIILAWKSFWFNRVKFLSHLIRKWLASMLFKSIHHAIYFLSNLNDKDSI